MPTIAAAPRAGRAGRCRRSRDGRCARRAVGRGAGSRAGPSSGQPLIAVALRGPWDADAYPEVGTVLASYGIQPPSLAAVAAAIVGAAPITGRLPVRLAG